MNYISVTWLIFYNWNLYDMNIWCCHQALPLIDGENSTNK